MGRERAVRVLADVGPLDAHAREALLVLEQVEEQPPVETLLEHDRIAGVLRRRPDPAADLALREPQQVSELVELAPALAADRRAGPTVAAGGSSPCGCRPGPCRCGRGSRRAAGEPGRRGRRGPGRARGSAGRRGSGADQSRSRTVAIAATTTALENGYTDVEATAQARRDVLGTLQEIHGRVSSQPALSTASGHWSSSALA